MRVYMPGVKVCIEGKLEGFVVKISIQSAETALYLVGMVRDSKYEEVWVPDFLVSGDQANRSPIGFITP